jgi:hypothetical protein
MLLQGEPFTRDSLEAVRPRYLFRLALGTGIDLAGNEASRLLAPLAGKLQRDVGINAQRDQLLLSIDPIFDAAVSRARGCTSRNRPLPSKNLIAVGAGLACRMALSVRGIRRSRNVEFAREMEDY